MVLEGLKSPKCWARQQQKPSRSVALAFHAYRHADQSQALPRDRFAAPALKKTGFPCFGVFNEYLFYRKKAN